MTTLAFKDYKNYKNYKTPKASRYCRFLNCSNSSLTEGKRLYGFPKDPERCALWLAAANNPKLDGKTPDLLHTTAHLCENHFADWCFMNKNDRARLVFNAVPGKEKSSIPVVKQEPLIEVASNIPTSPPNDFNKPNKNDKPRFICNAVSDLEKSCVPVVKEEPLIEVASIIHVSSLNDFSGCSELPISNTALPAQNLNNVAIMNSVPSINLSFLHKGRKKYTARESELSKAIKNKNDIIRKLRKKNESLKKLVKGPTVQLLRTILEKTDVSPKLVDFILRQVQLSKVNPQNRRFEDEEKFFAHKIFSESKSVYRILKSLFHLPSERSLQRFLNSG